MQHTGRQVAGNRRKRSAVILLLFPALLALTGCGSVLESDAPPHSEWWLAPSDLAKAQAGAEPALILSLTVVPGLDSDRILTLDERAQLTPYSGAHWPDHLSRVLSSQISRSLTKSRAVPAPISGSTAARALANAPGAGGSGAGHCELNLEVSEFFGRVNAQGITERVDVAISGTWRCGDDLKAVRTRYSQPVDSKAMGPIIAAFQSALDANLEAVIKQL